jgi:hypothetical protein
MLLALNSNRNSTSDQLPLRKFDCIQMSDQRSGVAEVCERGKPLQASERVALLWCAAADVHSGLGAWHVEICAA